MDLLRRVAHRVEADGRRVEVPIPGAIEDEVGVLRAELVDAIDKGELQQASLLLKGGAGQRTSS